MADEKITAEVVQRRSEAAGITIAPEALEDVARMMEQALAPLRELDLRAIRPVEPAVAFTAAWSE